MLDRPEFQLAASQSRTPRAAVLEAEVRHLELELAAMAHLGLTPRNGGGLLPDGTTAANERAALANTVDHLNGEVASLRQALAAVTHERSALRDLYERTKEASDRALQSGSDSEQATRQAALLVAQLEADRARLGDLLHASEGESIALSRQLSETQDQVEHISERVKLKLIEQKGKLGEARRRIVELEAQLEEKERQLAQARREQAEGRTARG